MFNRHVFSIIIGMICLILVQGCKNSNAQTSKPTNLPNLNALGPFKAAISLDRTKISDSATQNVFIHVRFAPPIPEQTKEYLRPQLNLGLVLDRSGSMDEKGKLEYTAKAAVQLVDSLKSSDLLSVTEYDDQVTLLRANGPLNRKSDLQQLIRDLRPRGSTNLCGGLRAGISATKSSVQVNRLSRVLLLSDGLANVGITNPSEIARFAQIARDQGISVSTMGVGLDYDENLLQAIAEQGGGNYYYIERPTQMASIFQRELGTLTTSIARDIAVTFSGSNSIHSAVIIGEKSNSISPNAKKCIANIYGGEERSFVIRLTLNAVQSKTCNLGTINFNYLDSKTKETISIEKSLTVDVTRDKAAIEASRNASVSAEVALLEADWEQEQSVQMYEQGNITEAKTNVQTLVTKMQSANVTLKDQRISKKIEALQLESQQMDNANMSQSNRQVYLKSSKQRAFYAKQGKRASYILQNGDRGAEVTLLQQKLNALKLYNGPVDGYYSKEVESAVKSYQKSKSITCDGIAGAATLIHLQMY
jgi:Ca-activated chloride channel family protein